MIIIGSYYFRCRPYLLALKKTILAMYACERLSLRDNIAYKNNPLDHNSSTTTITPTDIKDFSRRELKKHIL